MHITTAANWKPFVLAHPVLHRLLLPSILARRWVLERRRARRVSAYREFLKNVVAGRLVVRVPSFRGDFCFDVRSHILLRLLLVGTYEPEVVQSMERYIRPAKDVLDIGANVGLHAVLAARLLAGTATVLAVEPIPANQELLRENLRENGCENVVIPCQRVAVDSERTLQMQTIPGLGEYSSLGRVVHESVSEFRATSIRVKGTTIDSLVEHYSLHPGFIKLDVEGSEMLALRGAERTILRYKPVVLLELSDHMLMTLGSSSIEVTDYLRELGYTLQTIGTVGNIRQSGQPFSGQVLALPV